MFLQFIGFLLVGRLVIFVLQKFPFQKLPFIGRLWLEGKFLEQLWACDLCLGCYVFAVLSFLLQTDFIRSSFNIYIPIINEIITGMIASFLVHIFRIGWTTKFAIIELR